MIFFAASAICGFSSAQEHTQRVRQALNLALQNVIVAKNILTCLQLTRHPLKSGKHFCVCLVAVSRSGIAVYRLLLIKRSSRIYEALLSHTLFRAYFDMWPSFEIRFVNALVKMGI